MKELINNIIKYKKQQLRNEKRIENIGYRNREDFSILGETIYKKIICEDELFKLEISFCVWHGASIYFENKTSKYHIYEVFGSFSWFNEWVNKIYKATEIIDLESIKNNLLPDYTNLEKIINMLDEMLEDEYRNKRHKIFFDFISSQVKVILGE